MVFTFLQMSVMLWKFFNPCSTSRQRYNLLQHPKRPCQSLAFELNAQSSGTKTLPGSIQKKNANVRDSSIRTLIQLKYL